MAMSHSTKKDIQKAQFLQKVPPLLPSAFLIANEPLSGSSHRGRSQSLGLSYSLMRPREYSYLSEGCVLVSG